jgi:AcrR family transcriptional regulator
VSPPPEEQTKEESSEPVPPSEPRARRTHLERREEAERKIIAAALKIVGERGLQDITLAECGQAAGYSRGLAAHYFGSRDELIGAIARYIVALYSKSLRSSGSRAGSLKEGGLDDLLERVAFYITQSRNTPNHTRAFHAVLGAAYREAPLSAAVAEMNRKSIASYAAVIRSGMEAGEIRADVNPTVQASLIVATMRGVVYQWLVDPSVDLEKIRDELVASLRRSLAR